jgi:hypothetical protein
MPNVAEVIRDHTALAVECVDRLYLNAYVPGLQRGPGVVAFLRQRGQVIASPALFAEITDHLMPVGEDRRPGEFEACLNTVRPSAPAGRAPDGGLLGCEGVGQVGARQERRVTQHPRRGRELVIERIRSGVRLNVGR